MSKINDPGVRVHPNTAAFVIQMAKRSEQLEGIADTIIKTFDSIEPEMEDGIAYYSLSKAKVHQIKGYCEQLGIIADECDCPMALSFPANENGCRQRLPLRTISSTSYHRSTVAVVLLVANPTATMNAANPSISLSAM